MDDPMIENWQGRRVTVMGLGQFGGGIGAIQYLVREGARVTVTDAKSAAELKSSLAELQGTPPESCHFGGHEPTDFTHTDLVVASPAIPREHACLQLARQSGVLITSEMNLFWERNPAPVIAITGSNGKSTTTAMTHAILQSSGRRCWLGGNIGRSLLPVVREITPQDLVILELSSFQLEDLQTLGRSPHVAVVTNFSPNHLDRHGTLEQYRAAKQQILRDQSPTDWAVLAEDDADVREWSVCGGRLGFGLSDPGTPGVFLEGDLAVWRSPHPSTVVRFPITDWLTLPGQHNVLNALAASCAALIAGADLTAVEQGLRGYRALPHRLELVGEWQGRRFYNDSLATTPESSQVALAAFPGRIILFAGGYDKGSDLTAFARDIAAKPVAAVALMGTTGPHLGELIRQFDSIDPDPRVATFVAPDFHAAFEWAVEQSQPGDTVLLSPGCASYDWFHNFADRGEQFRQFVQELIREPSRPR